MFLGLDIGGTNLKVGIIDKNNSFIYKNSYPTINTNPNSLINQILEVTKSTLVEFIEISTIGIGIPGVVDSSGCVVVAPNLTGFINIPLKKILEDNLNLKIALENDANVAAYAELKVGSGINLSDFIFVTLGTGVGGAIIINNEIYRGSTGGAGEIGHIIINEDEDFHDNLKSYRIGTLEEYTGRTQIIKLANKIVNDFPDSPLHLSKEFDVAEISTYAENHDPASISILKKVAYYLGIGFSNAMNLLDINTIIIGGGISQSPDFFFEEIKNTIKTRALPSISMNFKVQRAKFISDAGLIGAALFGKYN